MVPHDLVTKIQAFHRMVNSGQTTPLDTSRSVIAETRESAAQLRDSSDTDRQAVGKLLEEAADALESFVRSGKGRWLRAALRLAEEAAERTPASNG